MSITIPWPADPLGLEDDEEFKRSRLNLESPKGSFVKPGSLAFDPDPIGNSQKKVPLPPIPLPPEQLTKKELEHIHRYKHNNTISTITNNKWNCNTRHRKLAVMSAS